MNCRFGESSDEEDMMPDAEADNDNIVLATSLAPTPCPITAENNKASVTAYKPLVNEIAQTCGIFPTRIGHKALKKTAATIDDKIPTHTTAHDPDGDPHLELYLSPTMANWWTPMHTQQREPLASDEYLAIQISQPATTRACNDNTVSDDATAKWGD